MRESLCNIVNVTDLKKSKELERSIEDDHKRATVNAVKLRAAAQNVDYPAFAALVSCAHLKPMTRKELDSKERPKNQTKSAGHIPAWSFDSRGVTSSVLRPAVELDTPTSPPTASLRSSDVCKKLDPIPNPIMNNGPDNVAATKKHLSCFRNPLFEKQEVPALNPEQLSATTHRIDSQVQNKQTSSAYSGNIHGNKQQEWPAPFGVEQIPEEKESNQQQLCVDCPSDSFAKEWKKLMQRGTNIDRLGFLRGIQPSTFSSSIFKVEIPPFLLGEILDVLFTSLSSWSEIEESWPNSTTLAGFRAKDYQHIISQWLKYIDGDYWQTASEEPAIGQESCEERTSNKDHTKAEFVEWIASIMEALSNCGRFRLAVQLMGHKALHTAASILRFLSSTPSLSAIPTQ